MNNTVENKTTKKKKVNKSEIIPLFNGWMNFTRIWTTILLGFITIGTIIIGYFGLSGLKDYQYVMRYASEVREKQRSIDSVVSSFNLTKAKLDTFETCYSQLREQVNQIPLIQQSVQRFSADMNLVDIRMQNFRDTLEKFNLLYKEFTRSHAENEKIIAILQQQIYSLKGQYDSLQKDVINLSDLFANTAGSNVGDLNSRERLLLYLLADNLSPGDPEMSMVIGLRWLELGNYGKAFQKFIYVGESKNKIPKDSWVLRQLPIAIDQTRRGLERGSIFQMPYVLKTNIIMTHDNQVIDMGDFILNIVELLGKKGYIEENEAKTIFKARK